MNETIQTRYTVIDTPMKSVFGKVYHKYLLYTDRNGRQYGLRGGAVSTVWWHHCRHHHAAG